MSIAQTILDDFFSLLVFEKGTKKYQQAISRTNLFQSK